MLLEAVTVCVNYGDFLAWTMQSNRHVFNNWVIVTDWGDKHTKRICDYYNVRCVQTDCFYENGASFNKANGINAGLNTLSKEGWVLHIDADIYLPPRTKDILNKYSLDSNCIYGIDRFTCKSFEEFIKFLSYPSLTHENWVFTHTDLFKIGTRIVRYVDEGYIPIGFFQLWNPKQTGITHYPTEHTTAARSDMLFAKMWKRENRRFIPDFISIHLESESVDMGVNWEGRQTKYFGFNSSDDTIKTKKTITELKEDPTFIENIIKDLDYKC